MGEPQRPSVGRIVHYYDQEKRGPLAAIITAVHSGNEVDLVAFQVNGSARHSVASVMGFASVIQDESRTDPHSWCWPPRVA